MVLVRCNGLNGWLLREAKVREKGDKENIILKRYE